MGSPSEQESPDLHAMPQEILESTVQPQFFFPGTFCSIQYSIAFMYLSAYAHFPPPTRFVKNTVYVYYTYNRNLLYNFS